MTTVPIRLQDRRRRRYGKAKAEKDGRVGGLYVHVTKLETLRTAYAVAKQNNGAPGLDGVTLAAIEGAGVEAAHQRLPEELAKLHLRVNEDKTRIVDLSPGESCGVWGFDFRRVRSRRGAWRPQYTPKLTQRTAVREKLKAVFQRADSPPIGRVIAEINPILRGGVAYFRSGSASRGCAYVKLGVEKKVRRHMMRARNRGGLGWPRWSTVWLHEALGLCGDYRGQYRANA